MLCLSLPTLDSNCCFLHGDVLNWSLRTRSPRKNILLSAPFSVSNRVALASSLINRGSFDFFYSFSTHYVPIITHPALSVAQKAILLQLYSPLYHKLINSFVGLLTCMEYLRVNTFFMKALLLSCHFLLHTTSADNTAFEVGVRLCSPQVSCQKDSMLAL